MEMIPHLFQHVPIHEKDQALRRYSVTYTYKHRHIQFNTDLRGYFNRYVREFRHASLVCSPDTDLTVRGGGKGGAEL